MKKKIKKGLNIILVSDDEAEKGDLLLCMPGPKSLYGIPSVMGSCAFCKQTIHWSKLSPKKPTRVCYECAVKAQVMK